MATRINLVELYSFYNDVDCSVIETLLSDFNINSEIRTVGANRLSADMWEFPEKRVAVEEGSVENAKRIIDDAIKNGVITPEGRFML